MSKNQFASLWIALVGRFFLFSCLAASCSSGIYMACHQYLEEKQQQLLHLINLLLHPT